MNNFLAHSAVISVMALAGAWIAVPSDQLLDVHWSKVEGRTFILSRDVPFGEVTAQWRQEIVTPDGRVCPGGSSVSGTTLFEERDAPVRFDLAEWASPCLVEGAVIRTKFAVVVRGVFYLRSFTTVGPVNP